MEFDLLLLHVVRLIEYFRELVVQLDHLELELVHVILACHFAVIGRTVAALDFEFEAEVRLEPKTRQITRLMAL